MEREKIERKADIYLSLLNVAQSTKRIYRKAILDVYDLPSMRGKDFPCEKDYLIFELEGLRKNLKTSRGDLINHVRRFCEWLSENKECTSIEDVKTQPKQCPHRKRRRKVSTVLSAKLFYDFDELAKQRGVDNSTLLNFIVESYLKSRKA